MEIHNHMNDNEYSTRNPQGHTGFVDNFYNAATNYLRVSCFVKNLAQEIIAE